jgi:hypothetical protein
MQRSVHRVILSAAVASLLATQAWAAGAGQCTKAASGVYKECKVDCKEVLQTAKDGCINKDHDCVEACREDRAACIDATGFEAAIDACQDARAAAVANCRAIYPPDSVERDQCIDNAQVAAYLCRLDVRKEKKPLVLACRKGSVDLGVPGFRPCVKACPAGAGPVESPKQCKLDAVTAFRLCYADCREDFRTEKDACRGLAHDCVEGCRIDRAACKDPIEATLDAAVAACQATKQSAITACAGDPACVLQAKVVAFQCRDDAREAARPGLRACRDAFRTCVQALYADPACVAGP